LAFGRHGGASGTTNGATDNGPSATANRITQSRTTGAAQSTAQATFKIAVGKGYARCDS
jgi:hypothetical protein